MASKFARDLFGLLGQFPVEIRAMVYSFAAMEDEEIAPYQVVPGSNKFRRVVYEHGIQKDLPAPTIASLIATCQGIKVELEAFQSFYKVNTFSFRYLETVAQYMTAISSKSRSTICNVVLRTAQGDLIPSNLGPPAGWTFLQTECQGLRHLSITYEADAAYYSLPIEWSLGKLQDFFRRHPLPRGLQTFDLHCTGTMPISGRNHQVKISNLVDSKPLELKVVGAIVANEHLTAAKAVLHPFKHDLLPLKAQCLSPKPYKSPSPRDEERLLKVLLASRVEQWGKGNPRPVSHRTRFRKVGRFDHNGHLIREKPICGDDGYLVDAISGVLNARVGDAVSVAEFEIKLEGSHAGTHWVSFESLMGGNRWANGRKVTLFYYQAFAGQMAGVQVDTLPHPHDLADLLSKLGLPGSKTFQNVGNVWKDRSPRVSF